VVVRVFRVRVHPGKEDEFERFVMETGIPMVNAQEGCTHVTVGKSRWSEQPEFVVVTHWGLSTLCGHSPGRNGSKR
jgi:quinol monooxygenase YgiN